MTSVSKNSSFKNKFFFFLSATMFELEPIWTIFNHAYHIIPYHTIPHHTIPYYGYLAIASPIVTETFIESLPKVEAEINYFL